MITAIQADLTTLTVDAIVNPTRLTLLDGGGVDGAIHRAAGPELRAECQRVVTAKTARGQPPCAPGEALLTEAYRLPCRKIIHTVGPVWRGGRHREDELLAACYENSLRLAAKNGLVRLAYPAISTGAYGFPPRRAAAIAIKTLQRFTKPGQQVTLIAFDRATLTLYRARLSDRSQRPAGLSRPSPSIYRP